MQQVSRSIEESLGENKNAVTELNRVLEIEPSATSVDTSLLYDELKRRFQATAEPIHVQFRQLVHWVKQGDRHTHQLHFYPARLLPNIAHFFVHAKCLLKPGSLILDPFSGSGTVALEASLAGYAPLIADANPFARLLTTVKTTPYDPSILRLELAGIFTRLARMRRADPIPLVNEHLWYDAEKKKQLEVLMRSIRLIEDDGVRNFFLVCFSSVARKLSLADPSISVPVRLKTKATFSDAMNSRILERLRLTSITRPKVEFEKLCNLNIERIAKTNLWKVNRKPAMLVSTDARDLRLQESSEVLLQDNSVTMVLTSPPYGSAQKYVRASSLSLNWLKLAHPKELSELEARSIGREHLPGKRNDEYEELPSEFISMLERVKAKHQARYHITGQYLMDMKRSFAEMGRVVEPGGTIVIVVGNNKVCGEVLRNDQFCKVSFLGMGFTLELHLIDEIRSRGLMTKRNVNADIISNEHVLVFKKTN
jgi:tRNA G10  N-methylase Trm11